MTCSPGWTWTSSSPPSCAGSFDSEQWAQLAVSSGLWLFLPPPWGMWSLLRSEVK